MNAGIDGIKEKIRKLFALSRSPNENEAVAAMEKAARLMGEYNLSENQCLYERHPVKATKRLSGWRNVLSNTVAWLYCCQAYRSPSTGEIVFFGESFESFMAAEMYRYLSKAVDRMAKQNVRKNAKASYRDKYRLGVSCRLATRITDLGAAVSWAPERDRRRLVAGRIFVGDVEVVDQKLRKFGIGSAAFQRGAADGDGISLNRQTGGHGGRYIEGKKPGGEK